jgi:MFS family permease
MPADQSSARSPEKSPAAITGWVAFAHKDFVLVFTTSILSGIGTFALQVAIGWEMWQATHEEIYLGLVGLFGFLPSLILFPITGTVVDRFPRVAVLAICYGAQTLAALLLVFAFGGENAHPVAALTVISLVGIGRAFSQPAGHSILPNVVPVEHFPNAVAWSSSGRQASMIVGPAIGGGLLLLGTELTFICIAAIFALNSVIILFVRAAGQIRARGPVTLESLFAGLRFIFDRQIVLGAISLDLFAVLVGSATALFPVYATDILGVGELGLGALRAAFAVGATLCGLALTQLPIRHHVGMTLIVTVGVYGLAMAGFGFSTSFVLSLGALFVAGAADMVSVFIRDNLVQLATPDAMRGRVNAVNAVFTMGSGDLGQVKSGLLAEAIGVVPSVVVGGLGVLGIAALSMGLFPKLRRVDALNPDEVDEGARVN